MEDNTRPAEIRPCTVKLLPENLWVKAARTAVGINPVNAPALHQLRRAMPGETPNPQRLALLTQKYWGIKGVDLTVSFLDNPPAELRTRILSHMNAWGQHGNIRFRETAHFGQVRISRTRDEGYWSYLGTDILEISSSQPTMNLDSFTMHTPDSEFYRVVRHETGHTLGFPHEHTRQAIIDRIDKEKAIAYFMRTQGWTRQDVIDQILTPLNPDDIDASPATDQLSIMCYWLPGQVMMDGQDVTGGSDLTPTDADFASLIYPKPRTGAVADTETRLELTV